MDSDPLVMNSKEKHAAYVREWNRRNPKNLKRSLRKYYENNKTKVLCKMADYRNRNRAAIRARARLRRNQNRLESNAKSRAWKKANKAKVSASNAKRRAIKKGAIVGNTALISSFIAKIRASKRIKCYYCRGVISGKAAHIDHIIPLKNKGAHEVGNLCATCQTCNLQKGPKSLMEWQPPNQSVLCL